MLVSYGCMSVMTISRISSLALSVSFKFWVLHFGVAPPLHSFCDTKFVMIRTGLITMLSVDALPVSLPNS